MRRRTHRVFLSLNQPTSSIARKLTEMGYGDKIPKLRSWRPHYLDDYAEGKEDLTNKGESHDSSDNHPVLSHIIAQLGSLWRRRSETTSMH